MMRISSQSRLERGGEGHPFVFSFQAGARLVMFLKLFIDSPFVCGNGFSNGMTFQMIDSCSSSLSDYYWDEYHRCSVSQPSFFLASGYGYALSVYLPVDGGIRGYL